MPRLIAKLILLPVRIDLIKARFYTRLSDHFYDRAENILNKYD